ncbi:hypothetical protein EZV62_024975 [Acer yangbiense]|uniref:DUF7733 domain-containing protein n=1 Tax=Acer yangbiense TaxID=1000413 RepID=A0A5C7GWM3_9ROSI|nr:hypothetical protein EZV62_024975 [Acer yangbiense]
MQLPSAVCGVADRTSLSSPLPKLPSTYASGKNRPTVVPTTTYSLKILLPCIISLAFPSHSGVSSSGSTEIIQGSKIFKLYVVVGTTVGLFLPLAYVLGSFGRGDDNEVRSATPHLFLLSFQILTENVSNPIHCEESLRHSRLANSGEAVAENVGWAVGFGVLAGALAMALLLFLVGIKRYRRQSPVGSPFTTVVQVFVAAARKWRVSETHGGRGICYRSDDKITTTDQGHKSGQGFAHTNQLRFLDKAMIMDGIDYSSETRNPWRLCSLNQVEEVKLVIRLIPIWLSCLIFSAVLVQLHTFYTKQSSTMIRSLGPNFQIPPASLQSLVGLTILITIPVYDRIFIPLARKFTGCPSGITMLQRIGIGLFLSILNMGVSGLVEGKRVKTASEHGLMDSPKAIVPMSVWWLLPQYMLSGISDVFTVVGLQELFYDQVPESMRSMGAAAHVSVLGVGSFINSALISIVQAISSRNGSEIWLGDNLNRSHLHHFYWFMAGLSALNLLVYVWIAKGFVYKKVVVEDETN